MDSLKAKNIIITGASSGIGEALAIQAAKIGANIVIASRNISKLEELKKSLNSYNNNIIKKGVIMNTLKKHGLLDRDFLSGLSLFLLPIIIKVVS